MPTFASNRGSRCTAAALVFALALLPAQGIRAAGARLHKSGPIGVASGGGAVWVANEDNDSVSRIDTGTWDVAEFSLGAGGRHAPRGVSVHGNGEEVWVACHDSDRVLVLDGSGRLLEEIPLPRGSGPCSVAISPDGKTVLAALHRRNALAVIDRAARRVTRTLEPLFLAPLGIAWTEDGREAWVTHLFADGEDPFLTGVDFTGTEPRVVARIIVKSTNPKQSSRLAAPHAIAEGGYLTFRGHLAQIPTASGKTELWLPTQYNNINEDIFSPDSTIQTTIRRLDLRTRKIPNTNADKIILTAVHVHDPQAGGSPYVGPGWDARISGPVDIGFSADGATAYLLCEQSDDVVVVPTSTPAVKPVGAAPLREIAVGSRPLGIALSPTSDLAFVANSLSRDVSVIDLAAGSEVRRIPVTPLTGEPLPEYALRGARLFHSSTDPRLSGSGKIACASCHPHGEHDGRHWDFHHLPGSHGPRSSMSLLGIGATLGPPDSATGFGQLHRSGDRDEIQDFEHTARSPLMGGTGFLGPSPPAELGPPSAGLDPDLDALAGYVASLPALRRSPHRTPGGGLTEAARRGATFFLGTNRASKPADAGCAACHVPETGFVDFRFHDVGQRRAGGEEELGSRTPPWHVNTPTLVGVWTSPPYDGVAGYAPTITAVLEDSALRARTSTPHGKPDGLTRRQLSDLAEFILSIDGDMTAEEVRSARDTTPPRILRVEPASLGQVDVWFSEAVDPATAGRPESWSIQGIGGALEPIASASVDPIHGDRVTLETSLEAGEPPIEYRVAAMGTILDRADRATGGVANALDPGDASNTKTFMLGSTLTVTLGASGGENIPVRVHDAAMVGPGLDTWSHDSVWVFPLAGGGRSTGFVRFDWVDAFRNATGVDDPAAILEAGFGLQPEWGLAQPLELRRVLRPWSDPSTGSDWNSNPTGGPSWRDHSHPSGRWTQAGAGALGGTGAAASDYGAAFDLAATVDATVTPPSINERSWFRAPLITEAFRFWFENPGLDHGYALRVAPGATQEIKFERAEAELGKHGPVLEITYALPVTRPRISFHRGNADGSFGTDISDAILVLNHLFLGLPAPACLDAADIQNDGTIDISDPIALLGFIFLGGEPPAAPGPFTGPCGPDPDPPGSPGDLGCHLASDC